MLKFGVLGPVTVHRAEMPADLRTAMLRRLVAILLCRPGQPMPVNNLLDALWEGEPPASARKTLQIYVHRLRRALGDDRVPRGPTGYALTVQPGELDALLFTELTDQAAKVASQGDPAGAGELLGKALSLWRGDAFADITCCGYVSRHAQLLEEQRLHALDQFASLELSRGRHSQLIGILTVACAANPYLETLRGHLMLALYRSGRQADALAEYRQLHQQMVDDLGVEPGSELQRLHERILRGEPDLAPSSVIAASGSMKPAQLPLDIRFFTGRTAQLKELDSILPLAGTTIATITGTAGVGKTTTAVHWAHQVGSHFPDGQLYVNLRGFDPSAAVVSPAEALRGFLTALGIAAERIPTELEASTALFRSVLSNKQMLLVLDNARDAHQVRPLLPGAGRCLVIITSRNQLGGLVAAEGAHPVPLDLLDDDESWQLLVGRLGARVTAEPAAAMEMIAGCARLPLALAVFTATALLRPRVALADLVTELKGIQSNLDALSGDDPLTDVRAVFSWSYRALGPQASRLFRLLAIHPGPEIAAVTAASLGGISFTEAKSALTEMTDVHLIAESPSDRYAMHDLLRSYATELLETEESKAEQEAGLVRLLDHYLHTAHTAAVAFNKQRPAIPMPAPSGTTSVDFPSHEDAQAWFTLEFSALHRCVSIAAEHGMDSHVWRLAWSLSDIAIRRARWDIIEEIQQTAFGAAERLEDPCGLGYAYRYLGLAAWMLGRFEEGVQQLRMALEMFGKAHRPTDQGVTCTELASIFQHQPRIALSYARKSLGYFRKARDPAGHSVALNVIGWVYCLLGDANRGLVHADRALQIQLQAGDHYSAAAVWSSVGLAYQQLGDYEQAITCHENSITCYRVAGRRVYIANSLVLAGESYRAAGRPTEARNAWAEAREIYDELGFAAEDMEPVLRELQTLTPDG